MAAAVELPPGFVLDSEQGAGLPAGFVLDDSQTGSGTPPPFMSSGVSRGWDTDPSADPIARAQKERIEAIPEITGSMKKLSENVGFLQGIGALTAFDPDEFGKILTKADPAIGVVTTPEGERIAVNNKTGAAFSINKLGPSMMDAVQFAGGVSAFTPAGRAGGLLGQVAGGMATQAAIEGGQAALGGEFNPTDVAIAGAAPVAINMAGKAIGAGVRRFQGRSNAAAQYADDLLTGGTQNQIAQQQAMSVPQRAEMAVKESAKRADIRSAIKQGSVESVGWSIDDAGRVVPDQLQRDIIKKGVNDKAVVTLRDMTDGDKVSARKMLDLADNYIKGIKGSERSRPQMVIGENAMKRFEVIAKEQEKASSAIGAAVKNELKGKPVDITQAFDEFLDDLDRLEVKVQPADGKVSFDKSLITGSNVTPIKNVINRLKPSYDNAEDLHKMKQFITNQINYDSPAGKPLDRQAENALKALRAKINDQLRAMSPSYAAANDVYSKAASTIKPFAESMGKKFDPESTRVSNYVGQELRRTLTNYRNSNDLITAIDDLDAVARDFGGSFDDDLMNLVVLNSELERIFGTFAPGSAQGVGEKAIEVGLDRALGGTGQAARAVYGAAKDRLVFTPPSKEKLELMKQLKALVK